MPWRHPTLADTHPEWIGSCDGCGASNVPADMMLDIRALPSALRALITLPRGAALPDWMTHLCDGCTSHMHRHGQVSHREVAVALGADADALDAVDAFTSHFPYPPDSRGHAHRLEALARLGHDLTPPRRTRAPQYLDG